ncbi:MAG: hypothetical protein M9890_10060 [Thermomicrobiales bacterium]|nr:hypothetical protein [Thermomicrobiales bacterium]
MQIYVGTSNGVCRLDGTNLVEVGLPGERVSAIYADGSVILAGTYGNGLYRSVDDGQTWQQITDGLTSSAFRTIVPDPLDASAILAGTEPARLYRSHDGGQTWAEAEGIPALSPVEEWYLPYSPRAGALRNVFAPTGGQRLLASVEIGGLLDSPDGGESWSIAPVVQDDDIHHITGHPDDPQLLFASLGYAALKSNTDRGDYKLGGVGRSRDGGQTWEKVENDYTRATLIPSADTSLLLAGPAPHVGREGRIVVSSDGGDSWQSASGGLESPMRDMVELFVEAPDNSVWAICSGGRLLRAEPGEWQWETLVADDAPVDIEAVAFVS